MLRNMGPKERIVRVLIGIAMCAAGLRYESWWGLMGVAVIIGAAAAICPMYHMFGIRKPKSLPPAGGGDNAER